MMLLPLLVAVVAALAAAALGVRLRARSGQERGAADAAPEEQDDDLRDPGRDVAATLAAAARRGQVLIQRLLEDLRRLQQREDDPERLRDLYGLDHLAVRLRRQTENLLLLAGHVEVTDPDEPPMRLVDLARLAASETEDFTRVRIEIDAAQRIHGWAGRAAAQLLSALLDNALAYSPPSTEVRVACVLTADTVAFAVADSGIGMDAASLEAANRLLAEPPPLEAAGPRIGLLVTARLARRLGATVTLRRSLDGGPGLTATVRLPAALIDTASGDLTAPAAAAAAAPAAAAAAPAAAAATPAAPSVPAVGPPALPEAGDAGSWLDFQTTASPAAPAVPATPALPVMAPAPPVPIHPGTDAAQDDAPAVAAAPADAADAPLTGSVAASMEPHDTPRRRRKRSRAETAWSMAMPGARTGSGADTADDGPSTAFVADMNQRIRPTATPQPELVPTSAKAIVAPSLDATPRFAPAIADAAEPTPVIDREPDDYVPEVVDNPLLDLLPDHPSAGPVAALLAPIDEPGGLDGLTAVIAAPMLDGITVAAQEDALPTRAERRGAPSINVTRLFADVGLGGGAADDGADALAGLAGAEERTSR